MMPSSMLGILSALGAALVWGSSDFAGGLAARRLDSFQVLVAAGVGGIAVLIPTALVTGEMLPSWTSLLWALLGGAFGAVGIAMLYRGLAHGSAAVISPTAAVIGVALPVLVGGFVEGMLPGQRLLGIAAGMVGIWMVSRPQEEIYSSGPSQEPPPAGQAISAHKKRDLTQALIAGLCFGGFFICMAQIPSGSLFYPAAIAKLVSAMIALVVVRRKQLPVPAIYNPLALMVGVLDAGGNIGFLLARQLTRLDVAAVLSSMYPAVTVALAWGIMGQKVNKLQFIGIIICLLGVALITI
ncbi:MAG: DMT family transporter [Anaerolineales bacterium]|nr:DMT family transporter [Anaerolineales bacterium]